MQAVNTISSFLIFMLSIYIYKNKKTNINTITAIMLFTLGLAPFSWIITEKIDIFENFFEIWILFFPFLLLFSIIYPYELEYTKRYKGLKYVIFIPYFLYFLALFILKFLETALLPEMFSEGLIGQGLARLISSLYNIFLLILNGVYLVLAFRMFRKKRKLFDNQLLRKQVGYIITGIEAFAFVFVIDLLSGHLNLFTAVFTLERIRLMYTLAILLNAILLSFSMVKYKFLNIEIKERSLLYYFFWSFFILAYAFLFTFILVKLQQAHEIVLFAVYVLSFVLYISYYKLVKWLMDYFFIKDEINYEDIVGDFFVNVSGLNSFGEIRNMVINELKTLLNIQEADLVLSDDKDEKYMSRRYFTFLDMGYRFRQAYKWATFFFPVFFENRFYGFLIVGSKRARTRFKPKEMQLITSVANQIAMLLHTVEASRELSEKKIMEKEINLARKIQFSLLPPRDILHEELNIRWRYNPTIKVGGDYCDVIFRDGGEKTLFVIADVSGKGINGAMYMSMVRTLLHMGMTYFNLKDIILYMNDYIKNKLPAQIFVTMALVYYDSRENKASYIQLGHNYPILFRSKEKSLSFMEQEGMGLGLVDNALFEEKLHFHSFSLDPGDFVFLYTDGVTEARNRDGRLYGESRLLEVIDKNREGGCERIINKVTADLYEFRGTYEQTDDIAMIIFEKKGPSYD
ncbi:MAG TPA: SpoIIE family protein phosphatase [Candidatus Mcinerneyibacteriales bacterium]|nr:SpoIIE family protein phosphatase [Candidatus Mcinerneyibacteriales bacterium]HPJ70330.1 SpoIIE family protein phosphatase [Candidatus Mcinerneyibacteriales bacterium]